MFDAAGTASNTIGLTLLGGEVATLGWGSTRGSHNVFVVDTPDGERLLALLVEAKAEALKGEGKAGVWKLAELPDLEFRIGGFKSDQTVKQCQSVVPPTIGDKGQPREWSAGAVEVAELPEAAFAFLEGIAERKRSEVKANHAATNGETVPVWPARQVNGETPSAFFGKATDGASVEDRAIAYLATIEPAISGQNGSGKTFGAVCRVGPGFDLQPAVAFRLIRDHYNPRCVPPWSEAELQHKVEDAYKNETRRGWKLADDSRGWRNNHAAGAIRPDGQSEPERFPFSNCVTAKDEQGQTTREPRDVIEMAGYLKRKTDGWPKRVGEQLFVEGDDYRPIFLGSSTQLFGALDCASAVFWAKGPAMPTQERFFEFLRKIGAERFESIEGCPKFNAAAKRCTVCGCSTALKPWLMTAKCPEGRWEKVEGETT